VYFGGAFTDMNNNSPAGMTNIARYIPSSDSWQVVGAADDVNGMVYVIKEGPDGKIYAGGEFTNLGVALGDYIAAYTPSTNTWAALGDPSTGATITDVRGMAWDSSGNLYVVGTFQNFGGVAAADMLAKWDGSSWTALGTLYEATVTRIETIAIDADDNIFVGGNFTNLDGIAEADYWAWWNGTAWASVDGIALSGNVYSMSFDPSGTLYVGGAFTDADGIANADYIFAWTGTAVEALDVGTNGAVWRIFIGPDGKVWASGAFSTAGTLSAVDYMAIWNGSTWLPPDVNINGTPTIYGIAFGTQSPTVPENYDIYIGHSGSGAGSAIAGDATVTNAGTAPAYPKIVIKRSGGTSARIVSVRNATTGKELSFDYALLNGETLTIDTHPDKQSVTSSFFGPRPQALLAGSDFADFMLLPGSNTITAFVDTAGSPTMTAYMLWADPYDGIDD
jgi:hypothetical protein